MSLSKYNASLIISLICVQMLDCIKQKFVEYVTKIHKNEYSTRCNNQILPWTINLTLEGKENNNNGYKTKSRCNLKSLLRQSSLNMEFFNKASKYELNGCKGNVVWIFKLLISFFLFRCSFICEDWSITSITYATQRVVIWRICQIKLKLW